MRAPNTSSWHRLTGVARTLVGVVAALLFVAMTVLPAFAADPVPEMITTGTGKKVELRFKPQVGSTQTVDFIMAMSMKMDGPIPMDMSLPGMKPGMRTTVTAVDQGTGNITYDLEIVDAGVEEGMWKGDGEVV